MTSESISLFIEVPATKMSKAKRKLIFGVGINDAEYNIIQQKDGRNITCPYYSVWVGMFIRCYSEKYKARQPTYISCSVAKEWHYFSAFKQWMIAQDWKNKHLDKDIINIENKTYSPDACVFVPQPVNNLVAYTQLSRGGYPTGVSFNRRRNKFSSECCVNGKKKFLGRFATSRKASEAYKITKSAEINRIALLQSDVRIKDGLTRHAEHLLNG